MPEHDGGRDGDESAGAAGSAAEERTGTGDRRRRAADERRVLVLNPTSGSEDHVDDVVERAAAHGFEVVTTEEAGDGTRLAREAAPDADVVAAAGGDGTVNEVVAGLAAADALETTALAVVPAGTGNNFASNLGVETVESAFEVIEDGRRRSIDLGVANERPFVNSCVGGLTAEASAATDSSAKRRLGVLAYARETLSTVADYDSPALRVATAAGPDDDGRTWEGEALLVLVGNARRFGATRRAQANAEDGLLEVTVVEAVSATDLVGEAARESLFGGDPDHLVRRRTPSLTVECLDGDSLRYSLDGEMLDAGRLGIETDAGALTVAVGPGYEPEPNAWTL